MTAPLHPVLAHLVHPVLAHLVHPVPAHHAHPVLAHQGGWDETLLVLGPMVVFAGLLAIARRRADQEARDEEDVAGDPPARGGDGGGPDR